MMQIERATLKEVKEVSKLYDDLTEYLATHTNYTGWLKGIYPNTKTALEGIEKEELFIMRLEDQVVGTVILNHNQDEAYEEGHWQQELASDEVMVIHTLAIHPAYAGKGLATQLLNFAKAYGIQQGVKAIRLDTTISNTPAQALYEKCGFKEAGIVDLRLDIEGLKWFKLYEFYL